MGEELKLRSVSFASAGAAEEDGPPSRKTILEAFEADYANAVEDFKVRQETALRLSYGPLEDAEDGAAAAGDPPQHPEKTREKPSMMRRKTCAKRIRQVLARSQRFYLAKVELYHWTRQCLDQSIDIEKIQLEIENERQRIRQLLRHTAPKSTGYEEGGDVDVELLDAEELQAHHATTQTKEALAQEIERLLAAFSEVQRDIAEAQAQHDDRVQELKDEVGITFANDCHHLERGADDAEADSTALFGLEQQLVRTTQDYLELRFNTRVLERSVLEEFAEAAIAEEEFKQESHECAQKVQAEVAEVARNTNETVEKALQSIYGSVRAKRMERVKLLEEQEQASPVYTTDLLALREEVKALRRKLRREKGRHSMDLEGFTRDVDNMRRDMENLVKLIALEEAAIPMRRSIILAR